MLFTRKPIADDVLAVARRLYEETDLPVREVASFMGIVPTTLYRNIEDWGWTRRRQPEAGARPVSVKPSPRQQAEADRLDLVKRLQRAVIGQLQVLEGRFGEDGTQEGGEQERSARALASLARTVRELHAIETAADKARQDREEQDDDAAPRDVEELRRALAERLERLLAARADRGGAGGK